MTWSFKAVAFQIVLFCAAGGFAQAPTGNKELFPGPVGGVSREGSRPGVTPPALNTPRLNTPQLNTPQPLVAGTNAVPPHTTLSGYIPDDKYKLRVGDKISLQILEDRDLPKSLTVADSGELDVPYVGRVPAS